MGSRSRSGHVSAGADNAALLRRQIGVLLRRIKRLRKEVLRKRSLLARIARG